MSKQFPPRVWVGYDNDDPFVGDARFSNPSAFVRLSRDEWYYAISDKEHAHLMEEKQKRIERLEKVLRHLNVQAIVNGIEEQASVTKIINEALAAEGKE